MHPAGYPSLRSPGGQGQPPPPTSALPPWQQPPQPPSEQLPKQPPGQFPGQLPSQQPPWQQPQQPPFIGSGPPGPPMKAAPHPPSPQIPASTPSSGRTSLSPCLAGLAPPASPHAPSLLPSACQWLQQHPMGSYPLGPTLSLCLLPLPEGPCAAFPALRKG